MNKIFSTLLSALGVIILSVASTIATLYLYNMYFMPKITYVAQAQNGYVGINVSEPQSELHIKADEAYSGNADIQLDTLSGTQAWTLTAVDGTGAFTFYNKTFNTNPLSIAKTAKNGLLTIDEASVTAGGQFIVKTPGARVRLENTSVANSYVDIIMASQKEHGQPDGTLLFYNKENDVIMSLSKDGTLTVNKLVYKKLEQK